MRTQEHWFRGHLREMPRRECMDLLESHQTGRVGFDDGAGPVVLPVNYTIEDGSVLFATRALSTLAVRVPNHVVAFEVDEADEYTETGWSVLVRGRAELVPYDQLPDDERRPSPWPDGARTMHIRIRPDEVSGRWLIPA